MAPCNRLFKAAFLLCILLLLLLNFSNFRTNNPIRASHTVANGIQWPTPLHSEMRTTNKYDNGKRSATNQNVSKQILVNNNHRTGSTPNKTHSNILSTRLVKPIPSTIETEHTRENPQPRDESDQMSFNSASSTSTSVSHELEGTMSTTQFSFNSPFLTKLMTKIGLNACPSMPPDLNGPINADIEYEPLSAIEKRFRDLLLPGGWYKPHECNPKDRVAIVIPYRDRAEHLPVFLKNIHLLLMKQQVEYGIFVIEQIADGLFNRAALMNVGFLEALKLHQWDCFIFHDVDLIPLDDRNLYRCPEQPRHMSVGVDTMGYKLPYSGIFGGVSAMTVKQFTTVNGFSNSFWGWGGEDDDMSNRLKHVGFHISRYPVNIARYKMLTHRKEKANPKRYEKLVSGVKRFDSEGLNSLKYEVRAFERKVLYTWILVEIKQDSLISVLASFFTRLK
ncbi:beta-1,4-N-acetylgalactosaminyltransferase bre-4-like isoform X2 [Sitodiplosis mosellana]|uniref:beta-1,4-N-acetylgalactosaminyltransferase bre-4-like isoform X2 n=1 Tax=Sitodiplosis mosellana TaxID=263140 RepID=UPI0024450056|nr:beta-1,4-N-acetylgalactosaminyltransferase bre-4-like isoform X2 [Sitodiplosis mosellana]